MISAAEKPEGKSQAPSIRASIAARLALSRAESARAHYLGPPRAAPPPVRRDIAQQDPRARAIAQAWYGPLAIEKVRGDRAVAHREARGAARDLQREEHSAERTLSRDETRGRG